MTSHGPIYEVRVRSMVFFVDGGLLVARGNGWVQTGFDVLVGVFERVGLHNNTRKEMAMVYTLFTPLGAPDHLQTQAYNYW